MMHEVIVLGEAADDLERGREYYDKREEGVGQYFVDCIIADIESLAFFHGTHRIQFECFRMLSHRFPFGIYYVEVEQKIDYTVQIWREGKQYVAHAMPLDVANSGETPEGARQAVDAAVQMFLATAGEHGTLDEVLEDAGYCREENLWRGPDWLGVEQHSCLSAA